MKKMKSYLKLFKNVRIPWILLLILFITSIISGQVEVRSVQITADIIDSYQNTILADRLLRYLGYLAAVVACGVSNTWIGEICYGRINRDVRKNVFNHLLRMPKKFFDRESADELVSRVIVDAGSSAYYFEILISTFGAIYTAVLVFKNLIRYNRIMGMYSLLIIPVSCIVAVAYGWFTFVAARKGVNSSAVTTGYLFERTSAFRT
ncbi:MAG: ABC transporter ATP-binding protein, partial [Clostridiales bacterium]|nr:ABC transporter ATP-binding protein [Candidatus Blautia equi]